MHEVVICKKNILTLERKVKQIKLGIFQDNNRVFQRASEEAFIVVLNIAGR